MNIKMLLVFIIIVSQLGFADFRSYVWTYEFSTIPPAETELEVYTTLKLPDNAVKSSAIWENRLEIEHGLTRFWDISLYFVFEQDPASSNLKMKKIMPRTRFKLLEKGSLFFDPLLYIEYKRPTDLTESDVLETKLIFAKDIENFNASFNFIVEKELANSNRFEWGYSFGVSYQYVPQLKIGIELTGNLSSSLSKYQIGPTIALASGKLWITTGVLLGIARSSADFQFRALIGLEL